jgi:cytochrome c
MFKGIAMIGPMKSSRPSRLAGLVLAAASLVVTAPAVAADADAAQALARQNNCFRCHAVDTKKMGPAWKDVAARLKGKKDAQEFLIMHLTTGREGHPVIKAKSPDDTKNLVDWILSL